jgi:general secretion pathway protein K
MLVAALAAAVVATLAAAQSQWQRNVELRRGHVQAQALVLAGLAWARQAIALDAQSGAVDHLGEPWALPLPPTPLENGSIEGRIVDAQARLNLNNVADDGTAGRVARARLAQLFARAGLPAESVAALADWIDSDDQPREGGGAETAFYAASGRATANAPLVRGAEATHVRGIDEARFASLAEWITALPATTALNVNTAAPEVLATALIGASGDALAAILAERARRPFASVADFRSRLPQGVRVDDDAAIGVRSDFFFVTVKARQGDTVAQGRALVHRRDRSPRVVWQTIE